MKGEARHRPRNSGAGPQGSKSTANFKRSGEVNLRIVLSLTVANLVLFSTGLAPSRTQDVCSYRTPASTGAVDV
jgi:hypothetical protein